MIINVFLNQKKKKLLLLVSKPKPKLEPYLSLTWFVEKTTQSVLQRTECINW